MDDKGTVSAARIRNRITFGLFVVSFYFTYAVFCILHREGILLRLCTWTLPVFVYLWAQHKNPFTYLQLQTKSGLLWAMGFCAIVFGFGSVVLGATGFNLAIPADVVWSVIILVGLSEEVVFRGFILQQIEEMTASFWAGNGIQAVLFTLTHVPYWLSQGRRIIPGDIGFVLVAGLILGLVFKKTRSLWACMLIHSVNNFCSIALIYPTV